MASFLQRANASNISTCSFGVGTTAGSIIIVGTFFDSAVGLSSVTDGGDAATTIVPVTLSGDGSAKYACVAFLTPAAGRTTITVNLTGGGAFNDIYIWEGAGLTSPAGDKSAFGSGTGLLADSGSTGTLTAAVELAIAFGGTSGSYTVGGVGWANPQISGNGGLGEEQVTAATTALHGTGTTSGTGDTWDILCATFMSAAGGDVLQGSQRILMI